MLSKGSNYLSERLMNEGNVERDERSWMYLSPVKVVWTSQGTAGDVENAEGLLLNRSSQISLYGDELCELKNNGNTASILLDFGREIHGSLEFSVLSVLGAEKAQLRIRFGESVMEAMSELGGETNATNDHAMRDFTTWVGAHSMNRVGESGFRFARIDVLTENATVLFKTVKAVLIYRDIPYLGSFLSDDERLNDIWQMGAYTVHLNMQKNIWDGIKRDRLVWVGDLHPEIMTIQTVFGDQKVIRDSLDLVVAETPKDVWMNGIPSYTMWWIINQHDYFMQFGNKEYLEKQIPYMKEVCQRLSGYIGEDGQDTTPEPRFVDWPTNGHKEDVDTGLQALHVLAAKYSAELFDIVNEEEAKELALKDLEKLLQWKTPIVSAKQSNALAVWAGLLDAKTVNEESLKVGGAEGVSTFMGGYILQARSEAGDVEGALETAKEYWGGMIDLGATTFWEDFDINWMKNAAPIDRFPKEGEIDVHGTYGRFCYEGFRHSFCHGWASGVTSWLTKYVLGVRILEPGCSKIKIEPNLCSLNVVKGTYPTPMGVVKIEHRRAENGEVKTTVEAPDGVEVIL